MASGYGKGTKGWQSLTEFFAILKKYGIPEENDEYWEHLIKDVSAFSDKYKEDVPLAHYIGVAFLNVQEHESRGRHTRDEMLKADRQRKEEAERRMCDRIKREIREN